MNSGQVRRRLSGAERRERFVDAAAQIVVEAGPSAVTMDGVAARTGVNKRLAYRFFANRDALLRAVLDRELEESGRRARALLSENPDLDERVAVNVRAWLGVMQERGPLLFRLLFDQDVAAPLVQEVNRRATRDWTAVYRASLDISDETAEVLARILLSALRGAVEALHRGVAPLEAIAEIYTAVALAGSREAVRLRDG